MTGLSLFTGIGGLDLAFEAAGGSVIAMCERDEFCGTVLHRHWPDVPVYNDVKTLRGEEIGAVDIIYGGFPCQSFSVAGQRKGKNDDRYLWPEFSRLVGELEPAWVVAENVPGILTLAADDVCKDLERLGHSVGIFHYEAAAVGALHRRARVFFVAHSRSFGDFRETLSHANLQRFQKQRASVTTYGEWKALQSAECCGGRGAEPGVGGMADGLPAWLDGAWWRYEPNIPRVAPRGFLNRVQRLKALGNAVVPAQIYPIFKAIAEIWSGGEQDFSPRSPAR